MPSSFTIPLFNADANSYELHALRRRERRLHKYELAPDLFALIDFRLFC